MSSRPTLPATAYVLDPCSFASSGSARDTVAAGTGRDRRGDDGRESTAAFGVLAERMRPTARRRSPLSPDDWVHGQLQGLRARHPGWRICPHADGWGARRDGYDLTAPDPYRLEECINTADLARAARCGPGRAVCGADTRSRLARLLTVLPRPTCSALVAVAARVVQKGSFNAFG
ncbi:hypothetical protein GCM10010411_74600 [Actinomadura fulvescens]|uniref:Uncharacterized protein n=1 Tax=Actinomadura fulvescens TaxID=46160 RepID=A0ABN3QHU3_9ACTN